MSVPTGNKSLTFRRYQDGDSAHLPWRQEIFKANETYKCPVYLHRTPPCQGSCPSGEDIRGWLNIVHGLEKPAPGVAWQEHAFRRLTAANPFPAVMGRVCPAPCESACNRNSVEDHVGINAVEHFIGNWALEHGLAFPRPQRESGRRVAIIGGGPAGLACAYHLRLRGHGCTIFESNPKLGGMMRYGIPGYRTPREVLDGEIQRILDMGVEVRVNCRAGVDVALAELEREYDAVFVGIGAQSGTALQVPGGEAPNCISGISFLRAFNSNALRHVGRRVVVIGGGDTAMDVAAVARRLGYVSEKYAIPDPQDGLGQIEKDVAAVAKREGAEVTIAYRRPVEKMPASRSEIEAVKREGVKILACVIPVEVVRGSDGRARALRLAEVEWKEGSMVVKEGTQFDLECDLIVLAIGQKGEFTGMEQFDNGKGLISADKLYRVNGQERIYVGGDVIRPHLLTTAVGHARIAADAIDQQLSQGVPGRRPKVDVCHFNLLAALQGQAPEPEQDRQVGVPAAGREKPVAHNYEDRSPAEVVLAQELFLGHFQHVPRHRRQEIEIGAEEVLGHFGERVRALAEADARAEAERCMSCGLCMECDNCVIYCPQLAVFKVSKAKAGVGRYVDTDYTRCIGCHICKDVCPSGYIQMGMGE